MKWEQRTWAELPRNLAAAGNAAPADSTIAARQLRMRMW